MLLFEHFFLLTNNLFLLVNQPPYIDIWVVQTHRVVNTYDHAFNRSTGGQKHYSFMIIAFDLYIFSYDPPPPSLCPWPGNPWELELGSPLLALVSSSAYARRKIGRKARS